MEKRKHFSCDMCPKYFKHKGSLKMHLQWHLRTKFHKCTFCSKSFQSVTDLTKHTRTHTGQTPYQCEICFRRFGIRENLTRHLKIHTCEKPHACSVCPKAFNNNGRRGLRRDQHRRISQSARPASCGSPTTGESSVASTSSAPSSPSVLSPNGGLEGATSSNGGGETTLPTQPSTSQTRKKSTCVPRWQLPGTLQQREELKPEVSGDSNSVEMTTTSDVAPLLP